MNIDFLNGILVAKITMGNVVELRAKFSLRAECDFGDGNWTGRFGPQDDPGAPGLGIGIEPIYTR